MRVPRRGIVLAAILCPGILLAQTLDSTQVDSALVEELAGEMGAVTPAPATPPAQARTQSQTATNPEISLIGDMRGSYVSEGDRNVDVELHEVEAAFRAAIDPYARGDIYVSFHQEDGEFHAAIEEAYLTTLGLPYGLQLKAGKFRSAFGKINRTHPHALPFIDVPAPYHNFLGHEGLNDQGLSLSWLVPQQAFFQELTVEVTSGPGESESFARHDGNRLLYAGRLKNFFDLSQNSTVEIGLSGAFGPNDREEYTLLGGADATFKWKPVRYNTYRSFTLQSEALFSRRDKGFSTIDTWGLYVLASYQLSRRWHLIGRYDRADLPDDNSWNESGYALFLGWYATEFQKLELGAKLTDIPGQDPVWRGLARLVFVIGTHGAHEY